MKLNTGPGLRIAFAKAMEVPVIVIPVDTSGSCSSVRIHSSICRLVDRVSKNASPASCAMYTE
eukprot:5916259-Pleurochrysis_carterae.AAC.2